jgi:hypothetical protein
MCESVCFIILILLGHSYHPLGNVRSLLDGGSGFSPFALMPPLGSFRASEVQGGHPTSSSVPSALDGPCIFSAWAVAIWEVCGPFLLLQAFGFWEQLPFCPPALASWSVPPWVPMTCQSLPHHPRPSSFLKISSNPGLPTAPQPFTLSWLTLSRILPFLLALDPPLSMTSDSQADTQRWEEVGSKGVIPVWILTEAAQVGARRRGNWEQDGGWAH